MNVGKPFCAASYFVHGTARQFLRDTWRVARVTLRNARGDDLTGEAAKMAFYFFLSLFPMVLILFAVTGIVGGESAFGRITQVVQATVPDYAWQFVNSLIRQVTDRRRPGMLSFGVAFALWAASSGVAALMGGLNTMYDVEEQRPWWKRRLLALGVLAAGAVLLVLGSAAFIPSEAWLQDRGLWGFWSYVRWPLGFLLLTGTAWIAYSFLPAGDARPSRMKTLVGAGLASTLWMVAALLFRMYVAGFGHYNRVYGAVGAVIVLLIWFYIAALAVLAGGELAATLESRRGTAS
jgi:membrane protein